MGLLGSPDARLPGQLKKAFRTFEFLPPGGDQPPDHEMPGPLRWIYLFNRKPLKNFPGLLGMARLVEYNGVQQPVLGVLLVFK